MVQSIRQNRAWIAMSVLLSTVLLVSPQAFGKPVTIQFTNTLRVAVSQQAGEVVEVNFVNMNPVPVASVLPPSGVYVVPNEISGKENTPGPQCWGSMSSNSADCAYEVTYTYAVKHKFSCSIQLLINSDSGYIHGPWVGLRIHMLDKQCTNYNPDVQVQLVVDELQNTDALDTLKYRLVNFAIPPQ